MSGLTQAPSAIRPSGNSGNLIYDVVELILDRGLVIDVFVRVSLVGIELVTVDARVVVASVDTYLKFAEACGRLDLTSSQPAALPEAAEDGVDQGAKTRVRRALNSVEGIVPDTLPELFEKSAK
jgi:gas vesicle structural protein